MKHGLILLFSAILAALAVFAVSSLFGVSLTGLFSPSTQEESITDETRYEEQITTEESLQCPISCDDYKPCTLDWCNETSNYKCMNTNLSGDVEGCKSLINECSKRTCVSGKCTTVEIEDCLEEVTEETAQSTTENQETTQTTEEELEEETEEEEQEEPTLDHVIITEFVTRGPTGATDEFVELYNPTDAVIDISGWKLQYKSATGSKWYSKVGDGLPDGSVINEYGFYLLASKDYSLTITPDYHHTATWGFSDSGGHVRVIDKDGNVIDKVGYGEDANEPEGNTITDISILSTEGCLERKLDDNGNYIDTDNNFNDFIANDVPTPQNSLT